MPSHQLRCLLHQRLLLVDGHILQLGGQKNERQFADRFLKNGFETKHANKQHQATSQELFGCGAACLQEVGKRLEFADWRFVEALSLDVPALIFHKDFKLLEVFVPWEADVMPFGAVLHYTQEVEVVIVAPLAL